MTTSPFTEEAAEDALTALEAALATVCAKHGLTGVPAAQFKFVAAIHLVGTVSQRAGLTKAYAVGRVVELLPRAMDASEGDQHIDLHRGGIPS